MTKDEFKEFADSDEGKDFLAESGFKSAEDIAGLSRKNEELLGKVAKSQKAKAQLTEVYDKFGIIDAEDLKAKLATLEKSEETASDHDKLQRRLEIVEKAAKDADERAKVEKALRADSEKRAQITSGMKGVHVNDASFDVLMPYFSQRAKVTESDNGTINLVVESDDGSSPFNSYIEEWSKTDNAKQFIRAPGNSGAGASGPGSGSNSGNMTMEEIARIPNRQERLKAMDKLEESG